MGLYRNALPVSSTGTWPAKLAMHLLITEAENNLDCVKKHLHHVWSCMQRSTQVGFLLATYLDWLSCQGGPRYNNFELPCKRALNIYG